MPLAETVTFDIPGWVVFLALVILLVLVVASIAGLVFGFRWAARAGRGDRSALLRWSAVAVIEAYVFAASGFEPSNGAFWVGGLALLGQAATFVAVRARR